MYLFKLAKLMDLIEKSKKYPGCFDQQIFKLGYEIYGCNRFKNPNESLSDCSGLVRHSEEGE